MPTHQLCLHCVCGGKVLADQDFRHLTQGERVSVDELIQRLERTFRIAYRREAMSVETRDALLYSQLQEGLKDELMKAPAVSGASQAHEHSPCVAIGHHKVLDLGVAICVTRKAMLPRIAGQNA